MRMTDSFGGKGSGSFDGSVRSSYSFGVRISSVVGGCRVVEFRIRSVDIGW